jgi:hypothetical protein
MQHQRLKLPVILLCLKWPSLLAIEVLELKPLAPEALVAGLRGTDPGFCRLFILLNILGSATAAETGAGDKLAERGGVIAGEIGNW